MNESSEGILDGTSESPQNQPSVRGFDHQLPFTAG